jgi:hypothetical protein
MGLKGFPKKPLFVETADPNPSAGVLLRSVNKTAVEQNSGYHD